ncbi:nucleoside hydrolase [Isachenkonia alkalipeptolytica]|uniref:Nucleoside hydrolase n=1 Tax=Isachenkonia alkalipeptolytica TaxID=2565777 RepID=A0AA43XN94_9CLOT|nr:nucleoside hydrolase [Isachenkonia alkalipeptolytica]NBG89626.1 nucleoside hydrolase [Isachenkonia alkalipeptolytica]
MTNTQPMINHRRKKVLLDVDTGVDDAIGIIVAATAPEIELLGITTVSGNIDLASATVNTLRVLKLLGKDGVYPVHMGASAPLYRKVRYATEVHGSTGLAGQLQEIPVDLPKNTAAEDFMIETIDQHPGEITLVMTAPQTNFAKALAKRPDIGRKLKEIIFMGGVADGRGNESPRAEFNIAIDPEAADRVLNCGAKITMVGLDVTQKALLTRKDLQALDGENPIVDFVKKVTADYMERHHSLQGIYGCLMHDPLAVSLAIDSGFVTTTPHFVAVETDSTYCDGETVCDFTDYWKKEANVHVAMELDREAFIDFLLNRIEKAGAFHD